MAPPQVSTLAANDLGRHLPGGRLPAETEAAAGETKMLRLLVRALGRVAEVEQIIAQKDALIDRLQSMAMSDPLTGLLNRRGFEEHLQRVTATADRYEQQGVLVYLDLDDFKPVNDRIGHEAGDVVLRHVAEFLVQNVRRTDLVARLGGDEFAVLMIQTEAKEGRTKAKELQRSLNETSAHVRNSDVPINASVGVTTFSGGAKCRTVMRRADRSMYRDKAKRKGTKASVARLVTI